MSRPRKGSDLSIAELEHILDDHRHQLHRLARERARLQQRLDDVDRRIHDLHGNAHGAGRLRNEHSLMDTIEVVLGEAGKPIRVSEIARRVLAAGYHTRSSDFRGIVNQTLIKDDRFVSAGHGMYRLKK